MDSYYKVDIKKPFRVVRPDEEGLDFLKQILCNYRLKTSPLQAALLLTTWRRGITITVRRECLRRARRERFNDQALQSKCGETNHSDVALVTLRRVSGVGV